MFRNNRLLFDFRFQFCTISFGLFIYFQSVAQGNTQQELSELKALLEKNHINPRQIDDTLSSQIFQQLLSILDPNHLYFTQEDIAQIQPFQYQLDEEILGKSFAFLKILTPLYKNALSRAEQTIDDIMSKPLNLEVKEFLPSLAIARSRFTKNMQENVAIWEKLLKYRILSVFFSQTKVNKPLNEQKTIYLQKENVIREKIKTVEKRKIKKILSNPNGLDQYVASKYLLAITQCYDPHSEYLTLTETQNFIGDLSYQAFSFGVDLSENNQGEILIERIKPGSPAWNSNVLHKGDVLVKLKWQNKDEIDLMGADLEEVLSILEQSNSEGLSITVRKADGTFQTVLLYKAQVREDENIVKSFIIQHPIKVGYISLPGFYDADDEEEGKGCAQDVAREVVKMKKEGVEGVILDLRFNGGGSFQEGLNLAGIFINEGSLAVSVNRSQEKPQIYKDLNRGVVSDMPLLLMVNGQSASASEVLAAVLQDYRRAIVFGSRTFGKSTGQRIFALKKSSSAGKFLNFVKITTDKFYRVTGKTAQWAGVLPDIELPDATQLSDYREQNLAYSLKADSVQKKVFYTPLEILPLGKLKERHEQRTFQHPFFNKVASTISQFKLLQEKNKEGIPLYWSDFLEWYKQYNMLINAADNIQNASSEKLTIENLKVDNTLLNMDSYGVEINKMMIQHLQTDAYLKEAYLVIKDWIELSKK